MSTKFERDGKKIKRYIKRQKRGDMQPNGYPRKRGLKVLKPTAKRRSSGRTKIKNA